MGLVLATNLGFPQGTIARLQPIADQPTRSIALSGGLHEHYAGTIYLSHQSLRSQTVGPDASTRREGGEACS